MIKSHKLPEGKISFFFLIFNVRQFKCNVLPLPIIGLHNILLFPVSTPSTVQATEFSVLGFFFSFFLMCDVEFTSLQQR